MKFRQALFVIIITLLGLTGLALAQSTPKAAAKPIEIVEALGKLKLQDLKKATPQGTETAVKAEAGSRLAKVGAVTRFTEPGGGVAYYFNRAGILVSAQSKAQKPIPKETLLREIKGLEFKKYPPQQMSAAFVRRSPNVVQGFYLDKDEKYVAITTYDYLPK